MSLVFIFREETVSTNDRKHTEMGNSPVKENRTIQLLHAVNFSLKIPSKCLFPDTDQTTLPSQS